MASSRNDDQVKLDVNKLVFVVESWPSIFPSPMLQINGVHLHAHAGTDSDRKLTTKNTRSAFLEKKIFYYGPIGTDENTTHSGPRSVLPSRYFAYVPSKGTLCSDRRRTQLTKIVESKGVASYTLCTR